MKPTIIFFLMILFLNLQAQTLTPEITSWIINTDGSTGYGGIESNIQLVQYSTDNVYVSATCIPGYDIGPWQGNPNIPANQNFVYKITRNPAENTGTLIETPLGHIGVWSNGVSIFNAKDAASYNNQGIWNQNAIIVEGGSFDDCLGHPAPNGEYHHHLNPTCLYDDTDSSQHSPIIGYAFDGFPVYGAYGFSNTNGTGNITRMKSSHQIRNITDRTTLPDGTPLNVNEYGPAISTQYPLGYYIEDFEFISGLGDLDEHNGRICVTPDYPNGIYCYFVTLDENLDASYPYTLGLEYYGTVPAGNTGPNSGHNVPSEAVTTYDPTLSAGDEILKTISVEIFPNPATTNLSFFINPNSPNNMSATLLNETGQKIFSLDLIQPAVLYSLDITSLASGIYFLQLKSKEAIQMEKVIVMH